LYLIPDVLRHPSGKPVEMNGKEAREAVTALNGGIQFGDGSEKANSDAVARREFKNGTLILPRQSDLSDKNPALNEMISNLSPHDSWCVTSTRGAGRDSDSSPVIHVRLKGDDSVKE
jgi:hypothetical protein